MRVNQSNRERERDIYIFFLSSMSKILDLQNRTAQI